MALLDVKRLAEDLPFGARVSGVAEAAISDEATRQALQALLVDRGVIVFDEVEPTTEMQLALSQVFGPMKDHPMQGAPRVDRDKDALLGVIRVEDNPEMALVEIDGKPLAAWQPWHFDACYRDQLNLAAILSPVEISPEGGETGFADGIQMYRALSPESRKRAESLDILYTMDFRFATMRFGRPKNFRELRPSEGKISGQAHTIPRAIHPAVWTRETGEKVLHCAGWFAVGIEGQENPAGDALFEDLLGEMFETMQPYYHSWRPDEMVIWDNTRFLHQGCGCDPKYKRLMFRTTIAGDYGFGRFESEVEPKTAVGAL